MTLPCPSPTPHRTPCVRCIEATSGAQPWSDAPPREQHERSPSLDTARLFRLVLGPERTFCNPILLYAIATGALGLSVPLSVQVLIGTVVNSALHNQVVILAGMLFALLLLAGVFIALQVYLMELFERRFFSRVVSEVTLRLLYARHHYMQSINRDDLVNRYFDIMTVQKSLPPLITGGLATFAVARRHHGDLVLSPVFFGFNIAVVLLAYLVFRLFDRPAARSDSRSRPPSTTPRMARVPRAFKCLLQIRTHDRLRARTDPCRARGICQRHARHFRYTFSQVIGFLLLYALASATLLGLGGWLVIVGQLTIGQLVAAELILAAIFYGLTRLGYYLELYYDLYAAVHKLLQLYELPAEPVREADGIDAWRPDLRFADVRCDAGGRALHFDFAVAAGHRVLLVPRSTTQVEAICNLLQHHESAPSGQILLGGHDVGISMRNACATTCVLDGTPFPSALSRSTWPSRIRVCRARACVRCSTSSVSTSNYRKWRAASMRN